MKSPASSSKKPILGSPQEWLAHAKSDVNLARLAKDHEEIFPEQVCFHAQQAAEKALKAVLLHCQIPFPLIHDIEEILEIAAQNGLSLSPDISEAGSLTPYAVEARYPGYEEEITPVQVEEAIHLAEQVVAWAAEIIVPPKESSS